MLIIIKSWIQEFFFCIILDIHDYDHVRCYLLCSVCLSLFLFRLHDEPKCFQYISKGDIHLVRGKAFHSTRHIFVTPSQSLIVPIQMPCTKLRMSLQYLFWFDNVGDLIHNLPLLRQTRFRVFALIIFHVFH